MKKIIFVLELVGAAACGFSQGAAKVAATNYINNNIKQNGNKQVTAAIVNTALNQVNNANRDSTQVAAQIAAAGTGTGSVTAVSAGNMANFATVAVGSSTTTPAFTFSLLQPTAHKFFGNNTGSTTLPAYVSIDTADIAGFYTKVRSLFTAGTNVTISNGVISSTGGGSTNASDLTSGTLADARLSTNVVTATGSNTISADRTTDGTTNKAFLATERTKLTGIATGATANSADATLLARANHTGTQAATTVTEDATHRFATDAEKTTWNAKQAALVSATNIKTINSASILGSGNLTVTGTTDTALVRTIVGDSITDFTLRNAQGAGDSLFLATGTNGYVLKRLAAGTGISIAKTNDSLLTLNTTGLQSAITVTTTGTSGAATLIGNYLNIPQYTAFSGTTASDITITDSTKGIVLVAPDASTWRVKVSNTGTLYAVPVSAAPPELLNFTSVSGTFTQSPTGTWGDAGYGVASKNLPASTDGWIEAEYGGTANRNGYIGFSTTSTLNQGAAGDWDYALYVDPTTGLFVVYGLGYSPAANFTGSTTAVVGDLYRLKRTGSTITAEYYRSGAWNVGYTFSATTSAQLYVKGQALFSTTSRYLLNPKGKNLQ